MKPDVSNVPEPVVSIIIPVFNKCDLTVQCLMALAAVTRSVPHEVIVVDNASADGTPERLKASQRRPLLLRNDVNKGFAAACNQGAAAARGKYLLFLNNDTIPMKNFLEELVEELRTHPEVVAAGSRLLYESGLVQHAGVAFERDSRNPYHPYRLLRPDDPRVNRRRELQAVTAACVLIRAKRFHEAGRFNEAYRNGYEDLDLCLELRRRGGLIVYQPKSMLIHLESQTPGRRLFDNENRALFFERWRDAILSDEDAFYYEDGYRVRRGKENGAETLHLIKLTAEQERTRWSAVAQAQRLAAAGKTEELQTLLSARQKWPSDAGVRRWAGVLCNRLGLGAAGRQHLEESLKLEDDPEVRLCLAPGDSEDRAPLADGNWPDLLILGHRCLASGDHAGAMPHFERALGLGSPPRLALPGLWEAANRSGLGEISQNILHAIEQLPRVHCWTNPPEISKAKPCDRPAAIQHPPVRVTIVIPTFNKLELTRRCLKAVAAHTPAPACEIVVVDNGSTDGTPDFLRAEDAAGRLRAIVNCENTGFAKACNQGAKAARGQYVVFLNNDTEVQSNWLGSLFSLAEADPAIAAVGSKLLFPDGAIQHAGIALADCWDHDPLLAFHIFAREKSDFPMANQRRVYQAVTGACVLTRKAHFDAVGGFDEEYRNGCEDVDLCLRFQQKGWLTVYEPASVVIHYESQSGPEPCKRAPENVERFHQKWLEHASPDVIIEQDGKNRMMPSSVMRLYTPPPGKLVSIIILAHNQLRDTQQCLASIEKHTPVAHELILVDNGSTDGTGQFFRNYAAKHSHARVVLNRANLGFSAGNNQGLACARGEAILLLNNDTVVTPGWLERMLAHLDLYPECGLVGPVSNHVSGPQLVSTANYSSLDQLPKFSGQWCSSHAGQSTPSPRLVGFCLLFRRAVLDKIGGLDPQFGSGNFEDDDYCLRAALAGFTLRVAMDSFVHHTGGQTFKGAKIDYRASMEKNWGLFKAKWSLPQDAPLDKGYRPPTTPPNGLALQGPIPNLQDSHTASLEGRCWTDKTLPEAPSKKPSRQPAVIALPRCALTGHLGEARELVHRRQWPAAWTAASSAIFARPYHPEACLLLAEIAQAAGDAGSARCCAQAARDMAPGWAPPKQFLKGQLRGAAKPEWLKLPPSMEGEPPAPSISVCLITKNEERFLAQCLRSVRALAAQIVVVDTGSADRTVEIAREFGAEVHAFAWNDDFSAARNAALEHATGDWILILDADEELMPIHAETILREIRAPAAMGYRLPIVDEGRENGGCSYVPRLFRNAPGLFFVGRIHEQAFSSIQVRCQQWGLKHLMGETALLHHGYTPELVASRNKVERNLRLLERAIEEMPGEPNLVMSLGLELVRSGKLEAGLDRYWEAFRLMSALPAAEVTPELKETLLTQLGARLMGAKKFSEIVDLWQIPFAKNGGLTASQHFCLGAAHMELKQPAEAAEHLRQCIDKRNRPALSPVNPEIHKAGPHHCLAMCLIAQNDAQGAQSAFEAALATEPSSRPMRFDLARFHAAQGRTAEALGILKQLASESPSEARVWELGGQIALSRAEHLAFARDWTAEAIGHFPEDSTLLSQRAEALLLNQEPAQALPLWRRGRDSNSPRHRAAIVLCELLAGERQYHFTAAEEPAISQEIIRWYRQSIRMGAHALLNQWHQRMETIGLALPSFARVLEQAHRQARQAAA
ncbi:MAG TPA: glycosyltransferase [Verrucomicrobiae bacterium]|jgi:GT2 family glycosyltransferase/Flp pilus assembly protein TadD